MQQIDFQLNIIITHIKLKKTNPQEESEGKATIRKETLSFSRLCIYYKYAI